MLLDKGWLAIIRLYKRQKNYKAALSYIEKAIKIDNTNIKYWKLYASINQKLRDFNSAAIGYTKCVELADNNLSYWLNLADTLLKIAKWQEDRKSTRLNSSHVAISYAVFCLKTKIILSSILK